MSRDLLDRMAFAIQDETMTRLKALRFARAALGAVQPGDDLGRGMIASSRSVRARMERSVSPSFQNANGAALAAGHISAVADFTQGPV